MFRIDPKLPVTAVKTYAIGRPRDTRYRVVSCERAECANYRNGWRTIVGEGTAQAHYIRNDKTRKHTECPMPGGLVQFTFTPGQKCFLEHKEAVDDNFLYVVRDGDWRGNPTRNIRRHRVASEWVEDFAEHQDTLATAFKRG